MIHKLSDLHKEFIGTANKTMSFGSLPITSKEREKIIIPIERWQLTNKGLTKSFIFNKLQDKTKFVLDLLLYEEDKQHNAEFFITENKVIINLITKTINKVTKLDKEYANYADSLFKEIVYISSNV